MTTKSNLSNPFSKHLSYKDEVIFKLLPNHPQHQLQMEGAIGKFHKGTICGATERGEIHIETGPGILWFSELSSIVSFIPNFGHIEPERTFSHTAIIIIKRVSSQGYSSRYWSKGGSFKSYLKPKQELLEFGETGECWKFWES